SDAQFDSLIAAVEHAYAVFAAEQHRVASGEQAEKALRAAHLFVRASKALALSRRHRAGVQNRLQIGAARLGQVWNLLTAAAGGLQTQSGEGAHAPSTSAPPIIGPALTVSAATRRTAVAPGSYATIFGDASQSPLGGAGQGAPPLRADALPFELAGASVTIGGVAAQLFHASPALVSFLVPAGLAEGEAEVIVTSQDGYVSRGTVTVARIAPGLFTRDASGEGAAVAYNGQGAAGTDGSLDVHSPANLGPDKRTRAFLFATGMSADASLNFDQGNDVRGVNSAVLPNFAESVVVEARTADARVFQLPVEFAGAGRMPGVDQITVVLAPELRGAGRVELTLVVAGRRSNPAAVNVR
ncbi:MAG: hypothetical protein LC800_20000, partial [Acidobacteria bacterium]|nr:hypothetical protein [Acidobacteriota bacterium]